MFEKLLGSSITSKREVIEYNSIIIEKNNKANAKRELYVLFLGIFMELFLIGVYDIPNIINNGWKAENGIYYLIAHTLLFFISLTGTFASYRVLRNKEFFLFKFIKYENLNAVLSLGFLSAIAVITSLDQVNSDSIMIYIFFSLITGFFFIMRPKFTFFALSVSLVIFIIGNVLYQTDTGILTSNLTNAILSIIVAFFISVVTYNSFVDHTITTIKLEESTKKLEFLSSTDDLTQISNRRKYEQNFKKEISRSKRTDIPISLIMFDIDHFKRVNDEFGHVVGDEVLIKLAESTTSQIRLEDTFARYGGEEFVIILSNSTLEKAMQKTKSIQQNLKKVVFDKDITITLSFGVTQYIPGEDSEEMFKRVDKALYEAKETGRDKIISR